MDNPTDTSPRDNFARDRQLGEYLGEIFTASGIAVRPSQLSWCLWVSCALALGASSSPSISLSISLSSSPSSSPSGSPRGRPGSSPIVARYRPSWSGTVLSPEIRGLAFLISLWSYGGQLPFVG